MTSAELEIPDASIIAWCQGVPDPVPAFVEEDVRRVAAPVVAAELRRIADSAVIQYEYDVASLRARADELDPPAKET